MKLENQINFLNKLSDIELNKIEEKIFPERVGIFLKRKIKNNSDIELSIRELENLTDNNNSIFIGKVGVSLKKENIINKKFEYDELFILPEYQGNGLGSCLLQELEKNCPAPRLELFTSNKSLRNLCLYERNGYTRCAEKAVSPALTLIFLEKKPSHPASAQNPV